VALSNQSVKSLSPNFAVGPCVIASSHSCPACHFRCCYPINFVPRVPAENAIFSFSLAGLNQTGPAPTETAFLPLLSHIIWPRHSSSRKERDRQRRREFAGRRKGSWPLSCHLSVSRCYFSVSQLEQAAVSCSGLWAECIKIRRGRGSRDIGLGQLGRNKMSVLDSPPCSGGSSSSCDSHQPTNP
jgi:hypothetical protein